jgi:hypothetical protein
VIALQIPEMGLLHGSPLDSLWNSDFSTAFNRISDQLS